MRYPYSRFLLTAVIYCVALTGCGGGGGGGSAYYGAANVDVQATPSKIDSGDRTQVTMELSDVHENGIAVKIRFPSGLTYVPGSSFLEVGAKEIDVNPTVVATDDAQDLSYVVVFLSQDLFRRTSQEYNGESGTLRIELVGRKAVIDGEIEVDPDVDDPAIDNSVEFDITAPNFVAEGSAPIEVISE